MRSRLTASIITAALGFAIAGCGSSTSASTSSGSAGASPTQQSVASAKGASVVMGDFLGPYTVDVAKKEGILDNLQVKLADQASGAAALPLMLSGRMDGVTDIGVPPLVTAAAKNVPLKIVWYAGSDPGGIYVKPSIQSAKALVGQNIATPTGSIAEISLAEYLQQQGVKFSQVKVVNLPPPSIVASYKTGQVAGASIWTPITTGLHAAGAKLMANQPETAFTVFTSSFVNAHPDAVQLYVCDIAKAQDLRRSDPKRVYDDLAPIEGASAATVKAEMPTNPASNQNTPNLMGTTGQPPANWVSQIVAAGRTMTQLQLIPTAPSTAKIQSMFDPQFAQFVAAGKCPK